MELFNLLYSPKNYVLFLKRKGLNEFEQVKKKTIKPMSRTVELEKRTYPIDMEKPFYHYRNKTYYTVDVDYGQVWAGVLLIAQNNSVIDMIMASKIIRDLAINIQPNKQIVGIGIAVVLILVGLFGGYALGNIFTMQGLQNGLAHIKLPW